MWICQTIFKFETHGFVHEIPMLENTYYLWQPYQKYSTSTKIVYVHLIREMKVTHDSFILLCFIANINKFAALTQFNFFFWYTVKPRKINSWTYIFQISFLVAFCLRPKGTFNLSDLKYQWQVKNCIHFSDCPLHYYLYRFNSVLE